MILTRRLVAMVLVTCVAIPSSGCGPQARFNVTGNVTLDGQPVPAGTVTFIPLGTEPAGRTAGVAQISRGRFATRDGRSPGSGRHRVLVNGCDGVPCTSRLGDTVIEHPMGKDLFTSHVVEVDLPAKSGFVLDIAVPKQQ